MPYETNYNTLTLALWWYTGNVTNRFNLGFNDKIYVYNASENAWIADDDSKADITVVDTEGNAVDLGTNTGADWLTFTIKGITTDLEFIYANFDQIAAAYPTDDEQRGGWWWIKALEWSVSEEVQPEPAPEKTAAEQALEILASADSYADVPRGDFQSVVLNDDGSVTVKAGIGQGGWGPNDGDFSGFGLKKEAAKAWLDLGFKYLTFTVELSADEGKTAPVAVVLYDDNSTDYVISGDEPDPKYCANGAEVTLDLQKIYNELPKARPWLFFILLSEYGWTSTESEGYLTFSNVTFSATNA